MADAVKVSSNSTCVYNSIQEESQYSTVANFS
jgi:hypothetical protein